MSEPAAADRGTIDSSAATGPAAAAASSAGPPAAPGPAARHVRRRDPVPLAATVAITVLGGLVLTALNGSYLGLTVTTGVAYAVVTVGMVLQLGYSRQLAFSQSVFMGVGAYGTGVLETKYGFSSLESLLAVIALAAVASLLMGAVVTRAPGLALALATLLLPLFVYQLAADSGWLGSFSGIDGVLPFWNGPDYESTLVRSGIISVLLLGLAAGLVLRVMRSGVGLQLMAMASDERLGESIGVSLRQRRLEVFVLGSVLAAVGGAVLVSAQGLVTPDVLSETSEITLLLMLFVAGRKSVIGAILGAIVIEYLTTSTSFISTNIGIIEGIALLVILLVEPDGVAGAVARLLGRRTDRWADSLRSWSAGRFRAGGGGDGARNAA
ncbi:MAG TPA: branched-chain amino acid ABC transporter permease [Streptosporangiaceae bacterium]|nr:branched-chain amino acid ABC transporter permease [Streptosporangiaceae bacterium]